MLVMYVGWKLLKRSKIVKLREMDLETDVYVATDEDRSDIEDIKSWKGKTKRVVRWLF